MYRKQISNLLPLTYWRIFIRPCFRLLPFTLVFLPLLFILQCSLPEPDDYVPPFTLVIFPYDDAVVADDVLQVRVEATDDEKVKSVKVYLDGEEAGTVTAQPFIVSVNVSGKKDNLEHVVQAAATDDSDNTGYSPQVRFIISHSEDVEDPVVSIVNPQDGQQVEGIVKIVAFAEDERSISLVSFFVDGDSVGESDVYPYNYDWNTADYADSTNHTIFARAFDQGGNWSVSEVVIVTVFPSTDQIPPTAILTYPTAGQVVFDTVQVTVEASDNKGVEMVEYFVDGQSKFIDMEAPYIFSWDTRPFANDGNHPIYAKVYDAAGNMAITEIVEVTVPRRISDDVIPPEAQITYPVGGSILAGSILITTDVDDNLGIAQVDFFIDGVLEHSATNEPWSYLWNTLIFDDGTHTIYCDVYDVTGNLTSTELMLVSVNNIELDITPPSVLIIYPQDGAVVSGNTLISVDASDNRTISRVEFYIDGLLQNIDTSSPWNYTWNTDGFPSGSEHALYVKAYDAAGNIGTSGILTVIKQ